MNTLPADIGLITLYEQIQLMSSKLDLALQMPCPACGYVLGTKTFRKCSNVDCEVHGMPK